MKQLITILALAICVFANTTKESVFTVPDGTMVESSYEHTGCGVDSIPWNSAFDELMLYSVQWRVANEWEADSAMRWHGDLLSRQFAVTILPQTTCVATRDMYDLTTTMGFLLKNTPCQLKVQRCNDVGTVCDTVLHQYYRCELTRPSK